MTPGETRDLVARTAKSAMDQTAYGVGGLLDWIVPKRAKPKPLPFQGPTPEGVALLIVRVAGGMGLDDRALERAADRLKEGGYNDAARNYGSIRCLVAHEHGTDGRCVSCVDTSGKTYFLRCFGSDERALRQLLAVVRARTMGGPIAPLCSECRATEAQAGPDQSAWAPCGPCLSRRSAELAIAVEQDPALKGVRKAKEQLASDLAGKPWFRGIGIGRDARGNPTLEVRVSKLSTKAKRALPSKVKDENGAWIAVRTEAIGDVIAQGTELAGYRSMEIHSKAPPAEAGGGGALDDLGGAADELGDWVGQVSTEADSLIPYEDERRSLREASEDKVHELAAAWAGLIERMRTSRVVAQVIGPLHDKWKEFWSNWQTGSTDGLEGAVETTNAAIVQTQNLGGQEERIKALRARVDNHAEAVKAGDVKAGTEPEYREYAKRWQAMVDGLKELEQRKAATFTWVTDNEILDQEVSADRLMKEWDEVGTRIALRRGKEKESELKKALDLVAEAKGEKKGAPLNPGLPESTATKPTIPSPTPDPLSFFKAPSSGKLVALGAFAAGAVLLTLKTLLVGR